MLKKSEKTSIPSSPPQHHIIPFSSNPVTKNLHETHKSQKGKKKKKNMIMEISSITLSLPKPPPSLPFSSSRSTCFNTTAFFNKTSKSSNSLVLGKTRSQRAKKGLTCNALFGLGVPELVVIAGVAALVFGPKKLPEVGKSIGKTVKSFQQAAREFESELKKEPDSVSETPGEQPTAISEEKKQNVEVSSSKESV